MQNRKKKKKVCLLFLFWALKSTQTGVCGKTIVHFVGLDRGYNYIFFQVLSFKVWLL